MTYRGADPTDVMGRRIGAYIIDSVIAFIVLFGIMYPLWQSTSVTAPAGQAECASDSDEGFGSNDFQPGVRTRIDVTFCFEVGDEVRYIPEADEGAFAGTFGLVSAGTSFVMLILLQGLVGASPGKLLVGLRVVKDDGSNAGIGRCLVRTILLFVDSAFCFLVGLVTAFKSQRHRRVGDMVASTMVISRSDQDALVLARSGQALPGRQDIAAQQWSTQNQPAPPTSGSWDAYGGIQLPGDPAPHDPVSSAWSTPPTSSAPPQATPAADGPTWDAARNAYIQYDQAQSAWMQFDDETKQWKPIDS